MKTKLGIDLGTTNTVTAVGGVALECQSREESGPFLPSVVAYLPNGRSLVGSAARRRRAIDPKNTIYSAKRIIGRRFASSDAKRFVSRYPFDIVENERGLVSFQTRGGLVDPEEVAAAVLRRRYEQTRIDPAQTRAVVSVPTKFGAGERTSTLDAVRRSGVAEVQVVDEPIATAWAYLRRPEKSAKRAAVYDLGGGTFDFAVVDCSTQPFQVISHGGDLYLGGDDIDRAIADWAAQEVLREHNWDLRSDAMVAERLLLESERAKLRCAYAGRAEIPLSQIDPSVPFASAAVVLEQGQIARLAAELIQRSFIICDEVIHGASLRPQDVDLVFLAGGTTQLPFIRDGVAAYFNTRPRSDYDPMEVVALGASIVADNRF